MVSISKRAADESRMRKMISALWLPNRGIFENLLRVAPYAAPFFGISWWRTLAGIIGSQFLGLSGQDLGRYLDRKLGTGPGTSPEPDEISESLEEFVSELIDKKMAKTGPAILKQAGIFSALLQSGKLAFAFGKGAAKFLGFILGLFGVLSVDKLIRKVTAPVRENMPDIIPDGEDDENIADELKEKYESGEDTEQSKERNIADELREKYEVGGKGGDIERMVDELKEKYNLGDE